MFDRRNIVYTYDGSFDGLLTAIFHSFEHREIPEDIQNESYIQQNLGTTYYHIETNGELSVKLQDSIYKIAGWKSMQKIYYCYLSNTKFKELKILTYIHRCYKYKKDTNSHLNDKYVSSVLDAALYVVKEAHNLKGFIRFSELEGGILYGEISPVNRVLPCLIHHFTQRYSSLAFMINDLTHKECLVYNGKECLIKDTHDVTPHLNYTESELQHRKLWKKFYETVEIKERHNEKCQMTHMPKRYWKHLTEMNKKNYS